MSEQNYQQQQSTGNMPQSNDAIAQFNMPFPNPAQNYQFKPNTFGPPFQSIPTGPPPSGHPPLAPFQYPSLTKPNQPFPPAPIMQNQGISNSSQQPQFLQPMVFPPQFYPQMLQSQNQYQQIPNPLSDDKEMQLKEKIKQLGERDREIRGLRDDKQELEDQNLKYEKQINELKGRLLQKDSQLLELKNQQQTGSVAPQPDVSKFLNQQIQNQNQQLQEQLTSAEEQLESHKRQVWELKRLNQSFQDENQNLAQQIEGMKKTADSQSRQIEILRRAQSSSQENQIQFQKQFQNEDQSNSLNSEIAILKAEKTQLQNIINKAENERLDIQTSAEKTTRQLMDARKQLREAQDQIGYLQLEINRKEQQIDSQKFEINQLINSIDDQKIRKQKLEQQANLNKIYDDQKNFQKAQQDYERQSQLAEQQKLNQMQQEGIEKQIALNLAGQEKKRVLMQNMGKIQCLYITDFPKNAQKYQSSIVSSVRQCCLKIKEKTGRNSFWGAIAYGAQQPGIIAKHFDEDPLQVENFLFSLSKYKVKFEDKPEDLKSALFEAAKMKWSEKIKLAIILSTSPCHGKQYHSLSKYKFWFFFDKKYDTKPKDDIEEAIAKLIQQNIVLLGIRYSDETQVMYNELEKIYKKQKRPDLFFTLQIKDMSNHKEIVEKITLMTEHLVGTNNQTTKTKVNQTQRQVNFQPAIQDMKEIKKDVVQQQDEFQKEAKGKKTDKQDMPEISTEKAIQDQIEYEEEAKRVQDCKDGALEALCKKGDFSQFEKRARTVEFRCNANRVEFKNGVFEKKKDKIYEIKSEDFDCHNENTWTCIRTEAPFAFGMMKKVYIMKKKGVQDELYVVKVPIETGPYKSMEEAVNDCRSHLISKALMNEFINKIKAKPENNIYPNVIYTDFLILQELNYGGSPNGYFWLAEKFFKGDFKKYNNNDGYISKEDMPLNRLAQAFSYYTYQASGFNYIVNDVQGVGNYFTDPAINSTDGKFDETDGGEEGIGNFLTTLELVGPLCKPLLSSIGIEMD